MKHLLSFMYILVVSVRLAAQLPTCIECQSILNGEEGRFYAERLVSPGYSALDPSNSVTIAKTIAVMTRIEGFIQINSGEDMPQSGSFSKTLWTSDEVVFHIGIDPIGETNYTLSGEGHFQSLSYALFGDMAGELVDYKVVDHDLFIYLLDPLNHPSCTN